MCSIIFVGYAEFFIVKMDEDFAGSRLIIDATVSDYWFGIQKTSWSVSENGVGLG